MAPGNIPRKTSAQRANLRTKRAVRRHGDQSSVRCVADHARRADGCDSVMPKFDVFVIVKVDADDKGEAEAMAADLIGCIPDSVIKEFADDEPNGLDDIYILKVEAA